MMENNNDWFGNLNYPSIDHQQQTYVTKHDLELLHKKIIATDLIVQKYQEANKALLRLQIENDDLKQQIEQITNECCIFSKQVTECTQECDNLKEQIEILNSDKRELQQQVRLLQDENTNNYHEIMVLRQFESLKETNDQLTKTVERQQKTITKLQLQLQRKSPVVYKPSKKQEPSETDIALTKSQKSVRELKLALGRLVNFIQTSEIEIPTALHIRPVLKAHEINDDFLEIEGDFVRKPVKKVSKPVVSQAGDDDDDDDDNGDFIDVNPSFQAPPVHTTDVIEETPKTSRQSQKKTKTTKKTRRKKDISISKSTSTKLDDLANELEIALSQSDVRPISQFSSLFSDDEEDKTQKSDKQQLPTPIYTPSILQSKQTNSSITISRDLSFSSDDEVLQRKLPPMSPEYAPVLEQQPVVSEQMIPSLQVDSITPMEIEPSTKPTKYMSFLSEDDEDDNNKLLPTVSTQEYISSVEFNKPSFNHQSQSSDTPSSTIDTPPIDVTPQTASSISVNTLDPNLIQIVLRLLNILTQVPVPLKPLRLVHRRMQQKKTPEEQVILPTEEEMDDEKIDTTIVEVPEQPASMEENNITLENQVPLQIEEQTKSTEEMSKDQISTLIKEQLKPEEENQIVTENETISSELHEELETSAEEDQDTGENMTTSNEAQEVQQSFIEENHFHEQPTVIIKESPVIPASPQETTPTIEVIQSEIESKQLSPPLVLELPQQSVLKPFQISVLSRLLNILTNLPVKPLILPVPFPLRKRKRKSVIKKPSIPLSRQTSTRLSRSPTRMQTRSLNSIRARIVRCNQPATIMQKRTTTEFISPPPPPISKRLKSNKIEQKNNEYDFINQFLNSFSKKINEALRKILEQKLHEDMSLFIDTTYRIFSELMMKKCDIILPLVNKLHPYEESIKILLVYINSKSSIFQQHFLKKLNQTFEYEIQQQPISNNRIKILNRLFILACSIFTSSSLIIYARLFDIAYSLSHDILVNAFSLTTNLCSSLISTESQINASNVLLHQILIDILIPNQMDISFKYLENLFINYHKHTHDREDLIRSLILLFRRQSWSWCSTELCSEVLFPLLSQINDQSEEHRTILMIFKLILSMYKDNEDFKRDINFHDQIKQRLLL